MPQGTCVLELKDLGRVVLPATIETDWVAATLANFGTYILAFPWKPRGEMFGDRFGRLHLPQLRTPS